MKAAKGSINRNSPQNLKTALKSLQGGGGTEYPADTFFGDGK